MNLVIQQKDNILKILVQKLTTKKEVKELLDSLNSPTSKIEVSFIDITYLQKEVILRLFEVKDRLKIYVNQESLKNYLLNLGFELEYENKYKEKEKKLNSLEAITIGGSAGSLNKFIEIVKNLPKADISVFIIMHQKPNLDSTLHTILQRYTTSYKVVEAKNDTKIEKNTIYTAKPGKHLIVAGGYIFLTNEPKRNFSRPSISRSFETLSNYYKQNLLSILVCGYGNDGTDSLENLKANHSTILIENPKDCEAKAMLENAIKTKYYDEVLSLDKIILFIKNIINHCDFDDNMIKEFLNKIYHEYGYDYTKYNLNHIKRRVRLFYNSLKVSNFNEFERIILTNKETFKDLFLNISVNITTFYRNPDVFKLLKSKILPKLDSFLDIKIWCAGCSSGEEPYSIAIFLKELGLLEKSIIYATDLNEVVLENAKNGLYSKQTYNKFLKNYYKAGGSESFSEYFNDYENFVEIKDEIKDKILFFKHNLTLDSKLNEFQLIFCRNVIIYFEKDLKEHVFNLFKNSLDSYGFLVLGESESLDTNKNFITIDEKNKIYKRNI